MTTPRQYRQCPTCNKPFVREKGKRSICCSVECSKSRVRQRAQKYMKQYRRDLAEHGAKTTESNTALTNLDVIVINGQPRIKGAVILEKLMRKQK